MAFDKEWNESAPSGTDSLSKGDDKIRDIQYAIRERAAVDHNAYVDEDGKSNVWTHKKVSLTELADDPSTDASLGYLYVKKVDGVLELFFKNSNGDVLQMTSGGSLVGTTAFRTGDFILSETTEDRNGWTDMSSTYNNKFIRLSSGTPLETGGSDTHTHGAGSYQAASHRHTTGRHQNGYQYCEGIENYDPDEYTGWSGELSVSGESASADNIPAYVQVRIWRKD